MCSVDAHNGNIRSQWLPHSCQRNDILLQCLDVTCFPIFAVACIHCKNIHTFGKMQKGYAVVALSTAVHA